MTYELESFYDTYVSLKKLKPILQTIAVSAVTSIIVSGGFFLLSSRMPIQSRVLPPKTTTPSKSTSNDPNFAKYETIINSFLTTVRKGQIETAYKETSPTFQKLTTLDAFKKLMNDYVSAHYISDSPCSLKEYTDPFTSSINGLPDQYSIVQTKCEIGQKGQIVGFDVEFMEDNGISKISYINVYKLPVVHTNVPAQ